MFKSVFVCMFIFFFVSDISAQGRRRRQWNPVVTQSVNQKENVSVGRTFEIGAVCEDALKEVNEARAKRGLKPYIYDATLAKAALACAKYRAARHMEGHCDGARGDFGFLPENYDTNGVVGGCAGLTPDWGFQACAMFDNYTFCGAASVMGSDGKRYCHLFCK